LRRGLQRRLASGITYKKKNDFSSVKKKKKELKKVRTGKNKKK